MLLSKKEGDLATFTPQQIDSFKDLEKLIVSNDYSCGIFENNYRKKENFKEAQTLGLDFDGGYPLSQAIEDFSKYRHIIAPTKSHQILKNGEVDDRFRVILFLSKPITDKDTYSNTVKSLMAQFPMADLNCKDASRYWQKSTSIASSNSQGKLIDPVAEEIKLINTDSAVPQDCKHLDFNSKPPGFSNCKWALANGFFGEKEGNNALMSLSTTCLKLNYTADQTYYICKNALDQYAIRTGSEYEKSDRSTYTEDVLRRTVVDYVYGDTWNGAEYVCTAAGTWLSNYCDALEENSCGEEKFDPSSYAQNGKQFFKNMEKVDWVIDGLLNAGGLSVFAGPAKSGKSTLTRQLVLSSVTEESFLGRSVNGGEVLWLMGEESPGIVKVNLEKLRKGLYSNEKLYWTLNRNLDMFTKFIEHKKPRLAVIDTLGNFAGFENSNSYDEVNRFLMKMRDLATSTGTHIMFIHHTNKTGEGQNAILGSSAIQGGVDTMMIFKRRGNARYIDTVMRHGENMRGKIEFDPETLTSSYIEDDLTGGDNGF